MRGIALILILAALATGSCATTPAPPNPAAQARLQQLIAGKVAGQPLNCLQTYRSNDMIAIDDDTLVFRDGGRVYVNRLRHGCPHLTNASYTLVTRQFGGVGLCSGDIAQVADLTTGMTVGSCVIGDFVPYTRP